ncbi:DUF6456 domain-containing protein [Microbaculum marinum]|uniref:DUF6456 domain-containing protein n=1 Tax=Microbaculum marinum TaxID=1764581 RepID=A0AAW9RPK1_9HYPH
MAAPVDSAEALEAERVVAAMVVEDFRLLAAGPDTFCLQHPGGGAGRVLSAGLVELMLAHDLLRHAGGGEIVVSEAGLAWLRRRRAGTDRWRGQHLARVAADVETEDGRRAAAEIVVNESPLTWLRRRKGSDGEPLVSDAQYRAGERLRADFERGRLGPRVTADWTRPASGRGRRASAGSVGELLDSTISARRRVETALAALGPELGSLLLDVCCFLTGLEDAERCRGWPRRSAKVVLRIALDRLADHYGYSDVAKGFDRPRRVLHWGADDYRPTAGDLPADDDAVS